MLLDALQSRVLFRWALEDRFAVLAVNADSPAALTDSLEAARDVDAPVIIETSLWQLTGRSFGNGDPRIGLARYLAELTVIADGPRFRQVPVVFHTDHIKGPDTLSLLTDAIRGLPFGRTGLVLRPSTLSLDSSDLSEAENIDHLLALCRAGADAGVPLALEMEAGVDCGVTAVDVAERLLAPVERAHPGQLCLWAPGLGTRHGLSGSGDPFSPQAVARHRMKAAEICGRPVGIALHGSSGLAETALREGVAAGVAKVNWSSESLLIRSGVAREYYLGFDVEPGSPGWKEAAMDHGVQSFIAERYVPRVVERMRVLGSAGTGARLLARLASDALANPLAPGPPGPTVPT